jgi:hypothetical protein
VKITGCDLRSPNYHRAVALYLNFPSLWGKSLVCDHWFWKRTNSLACKSCGSKQGGFTAEIAIHSPGLKGIAKPVWVFPKVLVCRNCGNAEFTVPETELRRLEEGGESRLTSISTASGGNADRTWAGVVSGGLRSYAVAKLTKLRALLTSASALDEARALLAEQFGELTLERTNDGLRANGEIDFFGEDSLTRVGGAGGPAWTERLPVRFDWLAA